jgi:hypothetical protein
MAGASEKQVSYALYLAGKMGYKASSYIDARLGKAMGLGMRARSGAGRLLSWLQSHDRHEVSEVIDNLKSEAE